MGAINQPRMAAAMPVAPVVSPLFRHLVKQRLDLNKRLEVAIKLSFRVNISVGRRPDGGSVWT
jgi:hypothetical protein